MFRYSLIPPLSGSPSLPEFYYIFELIFLGNSVDIPCPSHELIGFIDVLIK